MVGQSDVLDALSYADWQTAAELTERLKERGKRPDLLIHVVLRSLCWQGFAEDRERVLPADAPRERTRGPLEYRITSGGIRKKVEIHRSPRHSWGRFAPMPV